MTGIAGLFQLIVQVGEKLGGFEIGGIFGIEADRFFPADEGEFADVPVQLGERELDDTIGFAVVEKREFFLLLWLQIVEDKAGEIAQDDVARELIVPPLAGEVGEIGEGLRSGFVERCATALVLHEQDAGPEEIEEGVVAFQVFHRALKHCDALERETEALKETDPEKVLLLLLVRGVFPLARKSDGAVTGFIPTERRHGGNVWRFCGGGASRIASRRHETHRCRARRTGISICSPSNEIHRPLPMMPA